MNPPIVINAFKRPESLRRLLKSLSVADVPENVDLIFSLEGGASGEVKSLAKAFIWPFGQKQIIEHEKPFGLVGHYYYCGSLSKTYGAIIYLEDDLFVGTGFYRYALQLLTFYTDDEIAGFSLNSLWFNGYLHTPFIPIDDGNPCFFLQVPWYQGQIYTAQQWSLFETWLSDYTGVIPSDLMIHDYFRNFPDDDWFPIKTQYLIETNRYYCFPRVSHCVNFGDSGTHFKKKTTFFQTNLAMATSYSLALVPFQNCLAVYDSFHELLPNRLKRMAPHLDEFDFTVDMNGLKKISLIKTPYLLTNRNSKSSLRSFGLEMRPQELNVIYEINGHFFNLCKTGDLTIQADSFTLFNYYYRFRLKRKTTIKLIVQLIKSLFRN